jgi:hypothetical protein
MRAPRKTWERWARLVLPLLLVGLAGRAAAGPDLMVLRPTGASRDSLPVLQIDPHSAEIAGRLSLGFGATMLRLFRMEQSYLHEKEGREVEPAYLLLSRQQGGFPRSGFFLAETAKPLAGYVDLHESSSPAGRFGAMDQIFPHELAHVIQEQLAGKPSPGGTNQIHAVGVCTDPATAFSEGFAEHFQVMACDHPQADPSTRALVQAGAAEAAAARSLSGLRRELCARLAFCPRRRMTFLVWFSGAEQALRHSAVKANAFAFAPDVPQRLLRGPHLFQAYLMENLLPGSPGSHRKPMGRLLSTEGVVSAFFCRWANSPTLRGRYLDERFYRAFGSSRGEVRPEENVYLKIFHTFYTRKPHDLAAFIRAYAETFPEEAAAADSVSGEILGEREIGSWPQIRLVNQDRRVGTSMFDQFRGLPRRQTFDLNSASVADLAGVSGVTPALAEEISRRGPYLTVDELARVPGLTPAVLDRFRRMEAKWGGSQESPGEENLSIGGILRPYLIRAAMAWILASFLGAAGYLGVRRSCSARRAVLHGAGASFVGLLAGWIFVGPSGLTALGGVLIVFGLPAGIRAAISASSVRATLTAAAAWAAAALPAVLLTAAWF